MSVDGQDLTICGGCQGYMDLFSEVFCVVNFFFFLLLLYIFRTPRRNTEMEKTLSKTERKNKTLQSATFPDPDSVKALVLCFVFCSRATFPQFFWDIRERRLSPSLVVSQISREETTRWNCFFKRALNEPPLLKKLFVFTILAVYKALKKVFGWKQCTESVKNHNNNNKNHNNNDNKKKAFQRPFSVLTCCESASATCTFRGVDSF